MIQTSLSYANEKSFEYYVKYLALKQHFSSDYDFHKYNGKIRANFDKYRTRNDCYFFEKLSNKDDPINLMVANMIVKPNVWIREIIEQDGEERYIEWKKKIQSLSKVFKTDLNNLQDNYQQNFVSVDGQHPYVITAYMQRKISLETLTILAKISNIFPYWEEKIVDKFIAGDIIKLIKNYSPFLEIDEKKFKKIIRERFF